MSECKTLDCCIESPFGPPVTDVFLLTRADPEDGGTTSGDGRFNIGDDVTVSQTPGLPTSIDVAVDFVFVVDESSLLPQSRIILATLSTQLESELTGAGIGSGSLRNRFAVVAFGHGDPAEQEIAFSEADAFATSAATIGLVGGALEEDAYEGIDFAINSMPWRMQAGVSKVIFFITDEDRNQHYYTDGADQTAQFASLKAQLVSGGFVLAGLIPSPNAILRTSDNLVPIAGDWSGRSYVANGSGGYTEKTGLTDTNPSDHWNSSGAYATGMYEEYFLLLMDSDIQGYFFELNTFNGYLVGGSTATSVLAVIVPSLADRITQELLWEFTGWYDEIGTLVSTESSYSFQILTNRTLTARYVSA